MGVPHKKRLEYTHVALRCTRKVPRQIDSSKVEFPTACCRASAGARLPNK